MEDWHCDICDVTIDKRGRPGHLRSNKHLQRVRQNEEKNKKNEDLSAEPSQGSKVLVDDNPVSGDEKVVTLDKKGKKKKKEKIGEIRIIDGYDKPGEKKEDTSDKLIGFLTDPKNQVLITMVGNILQAALTKAVPSEPVQKTAKWGYDRDTGEEIEF